MGKFRESRTAKNLLISYAFESQATTRYITFEYDPAKLSFFERIKFKAAKVLYGEYPPVSGR